MNKRRALPVAALLAVSAWPARADYQEVWAAGGVEAALVVPPPPQYFQGDLQMAPDGEGGAFLAWTLYQDYRNRLGWLDGDIYVQHIDKSGSPQWGAAGVAVCTAAGNQSRPSLTLDGQGGVVVAWEDGRDSNNTNIYAQRVRAAGTMAWTVDGVALCTAPGVQQNAVACPDGSGGAVVAWEDFRPATAPNPDTGEDIYARRISAAGAPMGPSDGAPLVRAAGTQFSPLIAADGAGGALVAWTDNNTANVADLKAARLAPDGSAGPVVTICDAPNDQILTDLKSDGRGGYLLAWWDYRNGSVNPATNRWENADVFAQRLDPALAPLWGANGLGLGTQPVDEYEPALAPDGRGGASFAYLTAGNRVDLRAARVTAAGVVAWTGMPVGVEAGDQTDPSLVVNPKGDTLIAWEDTRADNADVYIQMLSPAGAPIWTENGTPVASTLYFEQDPVLTTDGLYGAVVAWEDLRDPFGGQVYTQRVTDTNSPGVLLGDVNGDGAVTPADAARLLHVWAGLETPSERTLPAGDVAPTPSASSTGYGDGLIDITDAVRVMRAAADLDVLP